ncbi:MAG: hypothetical protein L7V86_16960 [Verrucomicrobiales bacterium]|nr:hypothetical protein [Verrucomicrobiales bacterium]
MRTTTDHYHFGNSGSPPSLTSIPLMRLARSGGGGRASQLSVEAPPGWWHWAQFATSIVSPDSAASMAGLNGLLMVRHLDALRDYEEETEVSAHGAGRSMHCH